MASKIAQAGSAAALIAIATALIVVYILLLPEDIRQELLNGTTTATAKKEKELREALLVFEHPGTLDPIRLRDREKILDSFNLYSEKRAVVLKSVETTHIENAWLKRKTYNVSFKVDEPENTENYILAFDVINSQGRIIISLNGKEIFDSFVDVGNVEPIRLEEDNIKRENSLTFSVSGVGLAFWRVNEYDLRNTRVIADFTDVSKREYRNFFIISATEKENFEKTKLNFVPNCLTEKKGPLNIKINNRELFYQVIPDCGLLSSIEFDPILLKQGENSITFSAQEGNYFIDRVSIKAELRKLTYPFYYFKLEADEFDEVENETINLTLELRFADLEHKIGEINVNGHLSRLESDEIIYRKNINIFAEEGQNYVQIVPKTILNIVDLSVILEE